MPQPSFLTNDNLRERGLLSRFNFAFVPPADSTRFYVPKLCRDFQAEYGKAIKDLIALSAEDRLLIPCSEEAVRELENFHNEILPEKVTLQEYWSRHIENAYKYAGILHVMKYGTVAHENEVSAETMRNAVQIVKYFIAHRNHFSQITSAFMALEVREANYLLKHIQSLTKDGSVYTTKRELQQLCRGHFNSKSASGMSYETVLSNLTERGYTNIRKEKIQGPGRPSEVIRLNPEYTRIA